MKTDFTYNNMKFEFYPDKQEILIDGEPASGDKAPVGGVVVDMDIETPDICQVIRNIGGEKEEKTIIYDAPLSINEPVIILGDYVVSANLMVRHDLSGEFEVYKEELKKVADTQIGDIKKEADSKIGDIDTAKKEAIKEIENAEEQALKLMDEKLGTLSADLDGVLEEL